MQRRSMSEEQLQAFLKAVQADASLLEQVNAAEDADAVVAIAKAAGFVIPAEALKMEEDLSDEELKDVAGGQGWPLPFVVGKSWTIAT